MSLTRKNLNPQNVPHKLSGFLGISFQLQGHLYSHLDVISSQAATWWKSFKNEIELEIDEDISVCLSEENNASTYPMISFLDFGSR